jgi:hypothetical protein
VAVNKFPEPDQVRRASLSEIRDAPVFYISSRDAPDRFVFFRKKHMDRLSLKEKESFIESVKRASELNLLFLPISNKKYEDYSIKNDKRRKAKKNQHQGAKKETGRTSAPGTINLFK